MSADRSNSHKNNTKISESADEQRGVVAEEDQTSVAEAPWLLIKGFFMGAADVIPGVSGGTMALILGVYTRVIQAIKSVNTRAVGYALSFKIRELFSEVHWLFLVLLGSGMALAVVFFTRVVPMHVLMHLYPERVYGLFFGLIAGSVVLLAFSLNAWRWKPVLVMVAGAVIGYQVVNLVPASTPDHSLFVFTSGAVAITAMVLPGISGSFILLILGKYDYILSNISLLGTEETLSAVGVLFPFGLGMIAGIALFARLLSWMLRKNYVATLSLLIGFMVGSLYILWPFQEREFAERVKTETVPVTDERVEQIREGESPEGPLGFERLGEIVNPEAPREDQKIHIEQVSMKQIGSEPFWPSWQHAMEDDRLTHGHSSIIAGLLFLIGGFLLVGVLGYISSWKIV